MYAGMHRLGKVTQHSPAFVGVYSKAELRWVLRQGFALTHMATCIDIGCDGPSVEADIYAIRIADQKSIRLGSPEKFRKWLNSGSKLFRNRG